MKDQLRLNQSLRKDEHLYPGKQVLTRDFWAAFDEKFRLNIYISPSKFALFRISNSRILLLSLVARLSALFERSTNNMANTNLNLHLDAGRYPGQIVVSTPSSTPAIISHQPRHLPQQQTSWATSIVDAAYNNNMPDQRHILNTTTGNATNTDTLPQPPGTYIKIFGGVYVGCLFLFCLVWCLQQIYDWGFRRGRDSAYDADLERGRSRVRACDRKARQQKSVTRAPNRTPFSPQRQYDTFVAPFRPGFERMGNVRFEHMDTNACEEAEDCTSADRCMVCLRCRRMYDGAAPGMELENY